MSVLKQTGKSISDLINNSKNKDAKFPKRPNEFGNYVERLFREALQKNGYDCVKQKSAQGKKRQRIPECLLIYYLEVPICKSVRICKSNSLESSFRSFFYSPLEYSKINADAVHLLIGFETIENQFILTGEILITDLYDKEVTLKLE